MGFFSSKKRQNDVDPSMCNPIIINQTNSSIVVFQDRGFLYNKQILNPGEAVGMSKKETAGNIVPYQIHAVVGDERSLPTRTQSVKNMLSTAIIPTAFIVGTFAAASSAGTLAGPSAALGRTMSGMVIKGMVIDSTALAAGAMAASKAETVANMLVKKHPENIMIKSSRYIPGKRYMVVRGGIVSPLTITTITEKQFQQIPIVGDVKLPMDTLQDKMEYYLPAFASANKKTEEEEGEIKRVPGDHAEPPQQCQQQEEESQEETFGDESEEDRQLRLAIEESFHIEQEKQRKKLEEYQQQHCNATT